MDVLINVVNQKLKLGTNINSLVDGTQLWIRFVFNLGDDWNGLTTFAQFGQDGVAYNVYLDSNDSVFLPSEIKPGECTLMLYATGSRKKATTNYLTLTIDENIYVANARSTEITESLYEQLVDMVSGTTTDITALQTQVAINTDAIAGKADMSDLNHIEEIVENLENDEFVAQKIQDAVANEIERYIEGGQIGELVIEDGTLERVKVDTDFERTLVKADTAMQPSVYDPNGIEEDIYTYARQMDDTLTLEALPAQAKAVGDRLTLDSKQLENQNKYTNDSTFKYVNLRWERGQISPSTGEDNQYKARCRTVFISTKDIDAIEVCRTSDDYYFGFMYYLYDENKEWLDNSVEDNLHIGSEPGRQVYSGRSFQKHDLLAVPKHVPYIRIVAYAADWTYTELDEFDSNIIAESIRGVITNPDKKVFRDDEMSYHIPITCGRGNLYHDTNIVTEDLTYAVYRIRTPFISTSLVDSVLIDRTTFNYYVTIFYYNSVDRDPVTHQYVHAYYNDSVYVAGLPIDKTYPYFRIRVRSGVEDADTDTSVFTPWRVMQDFQFIREKEEPNFEIKTETNGRELNNGYFEKYYPLVYRRQDGEGAFRPYSDLYTVGMSRLSTDGDSGESAAGLIPIDDIDFIINDSGWNVYVRIYDSEKQFLQLYNSTNARIGSSVWTLTNEEDEVISAYLSIGAWPTNATGAETVLRKQDWYRNIHLCKNIESNEDLIMLSDVNANRCNGRNYSYVGLSWEQGGISGANVLTDSRGRLRTGFLDTRGINAVEIEKSATTAYAIYVFRYDENKQPMGFSSLYISYFPTNLDEVDIVALPQGIPYVRLVIRGYTRENDTYVNMATLTLRDVLGNVRGLKALNSETLDEKTNRINVGCMFGRGNMYYTSNIGGDYGAGIIEDYIYPSTKNRIMTPFIETDKVDVVYFDNTNCTYTVQIYYYDEIGMYQAEYYTTFNSGGETYSLRELAYPIYKTHKYFRLKLINAAGDGVGSLSPYTSMEEVKFFRHINTPCTSVALENSQNASARNMYEIYPKYNYRRTNTSNGQPMPDSNVYYTVDGGCVRVSSDMILADSIDMIVNDTAVPDETQPTDYAYYVYIHKYNRNREWYGSNRYVRTKNIDSSYWDGAEYLRIGFTPVNSDNTAPYLDIQDVYSKVHLYRAYKADNSLSGNILDLNPTKEVMQRLQQIYKYNQKGYNGDPDHGIPPKPQPLVLLHFSDIHNRDDMLSRIVEFRDAYSDYIHNTIHTGDIVGSSTRDPDTHEYENPVKWFDVFGTENMLQTIGNHDIWDKNFRPTAEDTGEGAVSWHALTEEEAYERFFEPNIASWDVEYTANHCYYYKDYADQNVLLIVLDCMHETQDQINWFTGVLNNVLDSTNELYQRHVVVANHVRMAKGNNLVELDSGFNNPYFTKNPGESPYPATANSGFVNALGAFVDAGGKVAAWICGHNHVDILATVNVGTSQTPILNIVVTTAGDIGRSRTKDSREAGTKSYDAFNIMGIDTVRGTVKVMRIGMDYNCAMGHETAFCWDYFDGKLVSTS